MGQLYHYDNKNYSRREVPPYSYSSSAPEIGSDYTGSKAHSSGLDSRQRLIRFFKVLIVLLLFVIFIQIAYHLYFAGNMVINRILIETGPGFNVSDEQVLKMAGISASESYFGVDTDEIVNNLYRFPQILHAEAEKKFPDALTIRVRGRIPLAVCFIDNGTTLIPAAVDANGIIFQLGNAVSDDDLVVLSGIQIKDARLGSVMPSPVVGFLKSLDKLRKESPGFYNSISELKFIKKYNDDFDVLMYPQNYSIPVRIGSRIDKKLFTYVILALDVVRQQGMAANLDELDFRTDEVVYKVREE